MSTPEPITIKWTPSPEITTHAGKPIPQESIFFCQPPAEIGRVISAYSSARVGKKPSSPSRVWLTIGGVVVISFLLGLMVNTLLGYKPIYGGGAVIWIPVIALFIFFKTIDRWFTANTVECTFIGENGWARGSMDSKYQVQMDQLLFDMAADLFTDSIDFGQNKVPSCKMKWLNAAGKEVGKIDIVTGDHFSPDGQPIHFALAVERIWNQRILSKAQTDMQSGNQPEFSIKSPYLKGGNYIRLTRSGITIRYDDSIMYTGFNELEPVQILTEGSSRGSHESMMLRKKGVEKHEFGKTTVTIPLSEVANVRALLILLERGFET
jgi:hypothetical protein